MYSVVAEWSVFNVHCMKHRVN